MNGVTTFVTGLGRWSTLTPFHFENLRTLHIGYKKQHFPRYLTFLEEHNRLTHLNITEYMPYEQHFLIILQTLNVLEELTLVLYPYAGKLEWSTQGLGRFLQNHKNLKRVNIINFPKNWISQFETQLKNRIGWNSSPIKDGVYEGKSFAPSITTS